MKKLLSLLLLFSVALSVLAQEEPSSIQTLPNITIKDMNGKTINVSDYGKSGKITVISFWATWCGPCKKELKNINEHLEEWMEAYDMQLVAISTDDSRNTVKVKPFVNGQGWEFDVLMDLNQEVMRALNAPNIPFTVIVDQTGKIVYTHLGYQEGDEFELEEKIKALSSKKSN
jgi:cytochrome c biogenesis protein CcmG/thiol:disulfide interchange protein DsbE